MPEAEAASLYAELSGLACSLGLCLAGGEVVRIREHNAKYSIGTGKAGEIADACEELAADCLVFDNDLSPSQQRNWEELTNISVFDRRELIIQIFADRARTKEAALQTELARLKFSLPRLTHRYINLSRQRGGSYGAKGSGETKFETDRRLVEKRIKSLGKEIEGIRKQRSVQRRKRERQTVPVCAIVGYTNSGKSTLLNALSGANSHAEDRLFATLDTTSRRIMRDGLPLILVDTVGFVRRLPHDLVDAFRSTLEEAALADVILHVVDASSTEAENQYVTTVQVLKELGAGDTPQVIALNKSDKVGAAQFIQAAAPSFQAAAGKTAIPVSAKNKTGLEELLTEIFCITGGQ
jgi:GTP-binding protein HflX